MPIRKAKLTQAKNIVIKIGTSVLSEAGSFRQALLSPLVNETTAYIRQGYHFILVSSGAIGTGMNLLKLKTRPRSMDSLQATASVGQHHLMRYYQEAFEKEGFLVAQILLTWNDILNRRRYLNAKRTFLRLLQWGIIPIVNENDTVSTEEIQFGDNDQLASHVAMMTDADLLINLSDVEGLYDAGETGKHTSSRIGLVEEVSLKHHHLVHDDTKGVTKGGMKSKLKAAEMTTRAGIPMVIANGKRKGILSEILSGEDVGTLFLPRLQQMSARERWIAFTSKVEGAIIIDPGAALAITQNKKSLLPKGILNIQDHFEKGAVVRIVDSEGRLLAQGISNFSSRDIGLIKGCDTKKSADLLGHKVPSEVVHRNNLVLL